MIEQYQDDTLVYSAWDIYHDSHQIGTSFKSDLHTDSIVYFYPQNTTSLLHNASFDQYFFNPITIVNDGHDQIQSLIPHWYSADAATPDYYSTYRSLEEVPRHFVQNQVAGDFNGYVGLVLYLDILREKYNSQETLSFTEQDFTETLQSKLTQTLVEGQTYCFSVDIRLSEHAGCSINRFGVLFTKEAISFKADSSLNKKSISFDKPLRNTDRWESLCTTYTASGGENYITLGRLTDVSDITIERREPRFKSSLDVNKSAYYLLDNVKLYSIKNADDCHCNTMESSPAISEIDDTAWDVIEEGDTLRLHKLQFSYDSDVLEEADNAELYKLLKFLSDHSQLKISIQGHSSQEGTDAYNLDLSYNRAKAVARWLSVKGIAPERLQYVGYGSTMPLYDTLSEEEQVLNRRVEVIILNNNK